MWPLLIFILLLLGWSALLWLALPLAFIDRPLPALALLHLAPPVVAIILLALIAQLKERATRRRERARRLAEQEQLEAERSRQRERHQQQLRERRRGVDARWAGIADGYLNADHARIVDDSPHTTTLNSDNNARRADDSWPERTLTLLMNELFSTWPLAGTLPLVLIPPGNSALCNAVQNVERARLAALADRPAAAGDSLADMVTLQADAASAHSELCALFEAHPEWPGALVVAFDCHPRFVPPGDRTHYNDADDDAERQWRGTPHRGLALLLVTPPGLDLALHELRETESVSTEMQAPFWDRNRFPAGIARTLAPLPAALRETLPPVVAVLHRTHRATFAQQAVPSARVEMTRDLIHEAGIDAGLIELPLLHDGEPERAPPVAPLSIEQCGWLVHNAGEISCGGDRLAQLSSALYQRSVELNPINAATNTVTTFGDCGSASSWLLLAHALQRVATLRKPVVCADFHASEMGAHFLTPPEPARAIAGSA